MAKHTINVSVLADTRQFRREMKTLGDVSGINALKKGVGSVAGKLKDLAKWAGVASVALGGIATKAAADLEQSQGTIDDIFKQYAGSVHKYASAAATDVGLSKNAYNELAAVISTQLKNGGTALDELSAKSNNLITLGADLAAGFGGSTRDAVEAISSALKGERDPIEKYGVSLRQAAIDAKAAELGFTKVGGALTDEASQAATLALIMEQSADMHGKFARETNTLAHQHEVLKAKLENMAATLGTYVLPALTSFVSWVADRLDPALAALTKWIDTHLVPALAALSDKFTADILPSLKQASTALAGFLLPKLKALATFLTATVLPALRDAVKWVRQHSAVILPVVAAIGGAVVAYRAYKTVLIAAQAAQTAASIAQGALNAALKANPIMLTVTAVAALVAALVAAYHSNETFRNAVNTAWTAIRGTVAGVVDWFNTYVAPTLSAVWEAIKAGVGLLSDAFSLIWGLISSTVSTAVNLIAAVFSPLTGLISGIINAVSSIISSTWRAVWSLFGSLVAGAWSIVSGILRGVAGFIAGIFNTVRALITGNWRGAWNLFKSTVTTAWGNVHSAISSGTAKVVSTVAQLPSMILSALGNLGNLLWNAGASIINGFLNGIKSGFNRVKSTLNTLTSWLPDWKGPAPVDKVILRDSGRMVIDGFIKGLEGRFPAVRRSLSSLTSSLPGMIDNPAALHLDYAYSSTPTQAAPVINLYTLNPTAEAGRVIARALDEHYRTTGRRA